MTSMVYMERTTGTIGAGTTPATTSMPGTGNTCLIPRCEIKVEKCKGGFKLRCKCDDSVACGALQNLCKMLAGSLCNCSCLWNGMVVCQCNLCCCTCECELTKDGCCITCTSGDESCCKICQGCGDCIAACLEAGCLCCVSLGNTPICCGGC